MILLQAIPLVFSRLHWIAAICRGSKHNRSFPEPATFALMLIGITMLGYWRGRLNR